MSAWNKFLAFIGIVLSEEEEEMNLMEEEEEEVVPVKKKEPAAKRPAASYRSEEESGNVKINPVSNRMIIFHPVSFEDARSIIDNLKARKPVIVNMEELDINNSRQILDFLSGAVYALNGSATKISREIFLMAPQNYDIQGDQDDEFEDM